MIALKMTGLMFHQLFDMIWVAVLEQVQIQTGTVSLSHHLTLAQWTWTHNLAETIPIRFLWILNEC